MKRSLPFIATLLVCSSALAIDVDPKLDRAVRDALPICTEEVTVSYEQSPLRLPQRFRSVLVKVESERHACDGQYVAAISPAGNVYIGSPWPLESEEGKTAEEKLKSFTWRAMQLNVTAEVDRAKLTDDGLYRVTLHQMTEAGKLPLSGYVDAEGTMFFLGRFRRIADVRGDRAKTLEAFFPSLPSRGAANAPVTIVEFSDFECPACRRAAGWAEAVVAKHPEKVRYVRFDLPLTGHPWAFPAALAGRAIHRQKPALFWEYKKQVYESQDELNAFVIWEWARAFAEGRDLDMARYDADLESAALKAEILEGTGAAFSNDVRATPTYIVNGVLVDAGDGGAALAAYVEKLLAQ